MPNIDVIKALLSIAAIVFWAGFLPVIIGTVRKIVYYHKNPYGYFSVKFSFTTRLLILTLAVFVSAWISRYVVAYYSSFPTVGDIPCDEIGKLGYGGKEIINSFLHGLQTFSMDENYTGYWQNGQEMIRFIAPDNDAVRVLYNIFIAMLNILAPIAGGAIVFEMLTKAFPTIRLFFSNFKLWKEKYYFSELNENSIALARSILSDPSRRYSTLIFTDAYTDDEEDESTERLLEAKAMGAICLKADLLHIAFNKRNFKGTHIFLIDKEENNNIGTLASLLDDKNIKTYQNSRIYVFSTDRKYSCIEDEVSEIVNLEKSKLNQLNNNQKKKVNMPYVVPVNIVRNMANTLMQELPLFEPLIGTKQKELTVTILGGGSIGTEMFLAAYRFGQILDVKLNINVISKEAKESDDTDKLGFNNKINFINPEILRSADPEDDILIYNCDPTHPKKSEPYMDYCYISADVMSDSFIDRLQNTERLINTDYFIVALGNDEDNFIVADQIKRIIGKHHLISSPERKTVIAYSIYNSDLAEKLNEVPNRSYTNNKTENDIFMYAFGCKDNVYSCNNVFFEGIQYSAYLTGENYSEHIKLTPEQARQSDEKVLKDQHKEMIKDIYNHMSSLARSMHLKYKIFSSGDYHLNDGTYMSVFHKEYKPSDKNEYNKQRLEEYKKHILGIDLKTPQSYENNVKILHRLAWLEHRRWNAFMRTCGFRYVSTEEMKKYYMLDVVEHKVKDHKFLPLKLHPCLVECSEHGIFIKLDENGKTGEGYSEGFDEIRIFNFTKNDLAEFDLLDHLSYFNRSLKDPDEYCYDFKKWDYPAEEKIDDNLYKK